jgi:Domain of unknown function (DUF4838)
MKTFLFLLIIQLFTFYGYSQENTTVYYTEVSMPANVENVYYRQFDTKLLAADVALLLAEATGKKFTIKAHNKSATSKGIFLLLDDKDNSSSNEQGLLETNGKDYILFKSKYTTGLSYAIYSWLEELGFYFYLPGNNWTVIPRLTNVFQKTTKAASYKPFFKYRVLGGNGGVVHLKGLDENATMDQEWMLWYRRNRMGSEYGFIDGHAGEAFNISHKEEIEKDPSMLAPINGKRGYRVDGKLDPTNKKGVALFSKWATAEYSRTKKAQPYFLPFKKFQSVDAGDGLNYCYTPECLKRFRSVSDQAFSIVNETARLIKKTDANAGVSTYAYTERADTPGIAIEKNVHVQVVASAFQNNSTTAGLMQRWAAKTTNLTQYDYLNITIWTADQPHFNLTQYHKYLLFVKQLKIEGMNYESAKSNFGSGILQYFILQFLNKPYTSIDKQFADFCDKSFGKAARPIQKLLREWYFSNVHLETNYESPTFFADELGRFIQYIKEAEITGGLKDAESKRIQELKAYVIYLCKMYELKTEHESQQLFGATPRLKVEKIKEILNYTWQFYETGLFHNTQLTDLLTSNMNEQDKNEWSYTTGNYARFKNARTSSMVNEIFVKMAAKFIPMAAPLYTLPDSFFKATAKYSADSIKISTTDETSVANYTSALSFYSAAPGNIKIVYQTSKSLSTSFQKTGTAMIAVEKDDYSVLKYHHVKKENERATVTYYLPAAGHYKLYLSRLNGTHVDFIIYPGNSLFYHNKKSIPMDMILLQDPALNSKYANKQLAIYTSTLKEVQFSYRYGDCINTNSFTSATGVPLLVNTKNQPSIVRVPLAKNQQVPFIFYSNSQFRWPPVLINTAPYYFFLKYPVKG